MGIRSLSRHRNDVSEWPLHAQQPIGFLIVETQAHSRRNQTLRAAFAVGAIIRLHYIPGLREFQGYFFDSPVSRIETGIQIVSAVAMSILCIVLWVYH